MQKVFNLLYMPEGILHKTAFILTLLIPFLLIVSTAGADIAVVLIGLLFLGHSFAVKDWSWTKDKFLWGCLVVWAWLFIVSFFAEASVKDSFLRAIGWGRFMLLPFALKHWIFEKREAQKTALVVLGILFIYILADTWFQYFAGVSFEGYKVSHIDFRLSGPFDKLIVGTYLAKLGMIVLGGFLAFTIEKTHRKRYVYPLFFSAAGALLFTILVSNERMAFLSFGLALIIFFLCARSMRKVFVLCSIPLAVMMFTFMAFSPVTRERVIDRTISQLSNFKNSHYGIIFNNSFQMIKEHPFMGVGLKNYRIVCRDDTKYYLPESLKYDKTNCGLHSHNLYLEWASEAGLAGMVLFISLMSWLVYLSTERLQKLREAPYYQSLGALCGLVTFLWPFMSGMSSFTNWNAVIMWYCIGWVFCFTEKEELSDRPGI